MYAQDEHSLLVAPHEALAAMHAGSSLAKQRPELCDVFPPDNPVQMAFSPHRPDQHCAQLGYSHLAIVWFGREYSCDSFVHMS